MYGLFGNSEPAPWATGIPEQIEIEIKQSAEALTNDTDLMNGQLSVEVLRNGMDVVKQT